MLQDKPKPLISVRARTNANLAKQDKAMNKEFFYWLGYFNGQEDIANKDQTDWENEP